MRVDGPLYQLELVRRTINQVTLGGGKPQMGQIASWRAGRDHEATLNHIEELGRAANAL
jgi:hypothetical protein